METPIEPLAPDETFCFQCHHEVVCFNACCRDLNQFITPYDIIRLKSHLGLSSTDFLSQYTQQHIGPETGLPIIALRPESGSELRCPFVSPEGCRVYTDRPSSCRMYPLARAIGRDRRTGRLREHFALLREPHCLGFETTTAFTPHQWMTHQGLPPYNEMNDRLLALISAKNQSVKGPLDFKTTRMFHLACYDLDAFRILVTSQGLLDDFITDNRVYESIRTDDVALLQLGMQWVKQELLGLG